MASVDEARLRSQNAELRHALRELLAMTRGAYGTADLETLRRACKLADVELPPSRDQFIAGGPRRGARALAGVQGLRSPGDEVGVRKTSPGDASSVPGPTGEKFRWSKG